MTKKKKTSSVSTDLADPKLAQLQNDLKSAEAKIKRLERENAQLKTLPKKALTDYQQTIKAWFDAAPEMRLKVTQRDYGERLYPAYHRWLAQGKDLLT